jgi:hypothetical protein
MCRLLLCSLFLCLVWCWFWLYYVCIVLMRVDEQATVESEVQQIEIAEQELIEGKLCPWSLTFPSHVLINFNDLHRLILMGAFMLPQFWLPLYLVHPWNNFWVVLAIALCGLGMEIHYSWLFCYYLVVTTVHVKIIKLMGTWSDHPGKQCYHKGLMGRPWLIN